MNKTAFEMKLDQVCLEAWNDASPEEKEDLGSFDDFKNEVRYTWEADRAIEDLMKKGLIQQTT